MKIPLASSWSSLSEEERKSVIARPAMSESQKLQKTVKSILEKVKSDGDSAVIEYTKAFDCPNLESLRLPLEKIETASSYISDDVIAAIDLAYTNIRKFHEAQIPNDVKVETQPGVMCELKHTAIEKVGLYIPGGSAPLPSTVLMLGVCAQVAGCAVPILCSPPGKNGTLAPEILYAAQKCGIRDVFLCGGAQAIAAMAYGTESIEKVDKIYGPGNSFVTEAKQQVSQQVFGAAIDMPAGPSEVLVLADNSANAEFVASDLLSQAEHGVDSQAVVVADDADFIDRVREAVKEQLKALARKEIAEQSIANSRFIVTDSLEASINVVNRYAAEHLIIQTKDSSDVAKRVKNAGSIFVGEFSPESAGDYASGTNHVLPTYGYSRNYSSLGLLDFMRRFTVQTLTQEGLRHIGPAIINLANAEGLDAHANAVAIRLNQLKKGDSPKLGPKA